MRLNPSPIQFGTDGWRGVLGVDFTLERLVPVVAAAAQELAYRAPKGLKSRTIVIGYDRRFLAREFAEVTAAVVKGCELEPLLAQAPVTTPACSWAVVARKALGALVITASHNPPEWIGLKIKGPFGGSVERGFTQAVEQRIAAGGITVPRDVTPQSFDARGEHLKALREKVDLKALIRGIREMGLKVIVDPMHGSAAGCLGELLGEVGPDYFQEIRSERDPLFGGNPPEPLASYLLELIDAIKASACSGKPAIGLVFDGDGDRIAAVDEFGRYCSTQVLMPLLIDHLGRSRNLTGSVVKTVSGSDLMRFVAEDLGRDVIELPVGFKYIAAEMLSSSVLIGGEESGGIGFGIHLPERDALFSSLLLLEALTQVSKPLGVRIDALKGRFGDSCFDRIDLRLSDMNARVRLEELLNKKPPSSVSKQKVLEVIRTDGLKLRLGKSYWLMLRFSGTEPLLRIYCEAPNEDKLRIALSWAKELAEKA